MFSLILGGSGSGKSNYAEKQMMLFSGRKIYLATMEPYGREAHLRIEKHRKMRKDRGFETVERGLNLRDLRIPDGCSVLLEDMGNLAANELFDPRGGGTPAVLSGIDALLQKSRNLVVVTNEIFSDGRKYEEETVRYLRELAFINRKMAEKADLVTEVICGLPNILKGGRGA